MNMYGCLLISCTVCNIGHMKSGLVLVWCDLGCVLSGRLIRELILSNGSFGSVGSVTS